MTQPLTRGRIIAYRLVRWALHEATTFHLVALDDHGKIVIREKLYRKQLLAYTANRHYWWASKTVLRAWAARRCWCRISSKHS